MSDDKLEELRKKKYESYMERQSMPKDIIHLDSSQDFNDLVNKYPEKIIILDFWAEWCGPCKTFAPVFERLQEEYSNTYIFGKVNVDKNSKLAQRFGISGIPTTLFVKNGEVIHKKVGATNYKGMQAVLQKISSKV